MSDEEEHALDESDRRASLSSLSIFIYLSAPADVPPRPEHGAAASGGAVPLLEHAVGGPCVVAFRVEKRKKMSFFSMALPRSTGPSIEPQTTLSSSPPHQIGRASCRERV